MASGKFAEQGRNLPRAECNRDIHTEQSSCLDSVGGNGSIGRLDVGQNTLGRFQVIAPGLGDRQPARGAVKELHAQPGFERGDVLGDHGLRHAQGPARSRQAAGRGYF
jgi:hypothetical protein